MYITFFFSKFQSKSSEKGLKISSFASLSTNAADKSSDTGLKIASVSGGKSPLKIANVTGSASTGNDDDIVTLDAESDSSASKTNSSQQKKPVLKLASFAG